MGALKLSLPLKRGLNRRTPVATLALVSGQGRALQLLPDPSELFATGEASGRRRAPALRKNNNGRAGGTTEPQAAPPRSESPESVS